MLKWLKLSQHIHSGRLRPHGHTSYLPLGLLLLVVGLLLVTYTVHAATPYDGPEGGSIGITGIMPGEPPKIAPTIDVPTNQEHFTTSPITVSGTCPTNTLVELYKNDIFAGSTPCTGSGVYSLQIDLMIGQNILLARDYDALNQAGPDSITKTVYYDALPTQAGPLSSSTFGGAQLLLNTDAVFRGTFPNQELNMPIQIIGGTGPYAVDIEWGNGSNKIISLSNDGTFNATHIYTKAGTYQVTIQATDSLGHLAFLTVAVIVNGQPGATTTATTSGPTVNQLLLLWPLYTALAAVVTSFWLGEQREKRVLRKHGLLLPS